MATNHQYFNILLFEWQQFKSPSQSEHIVVLQVERNGKRWPLFSLYMLPLGTRLIKFFFFFSFSLNK